MQRARGPPRRTEHRLVREAYAPYQSKVSHAGHVPSKDRGMNGKSRGRKDRFTP